MVRRLCSGPTACRGSRSLSRRAAARTAILYAFDLIEHNGEDLRKRPFLTGSPRWRRSCVIVKRASCLTNP
jgi:hypothetical protein